VPFPFLASLYGNVKTAIAYENIVWRGWHLRCRERHRSHPSGALVILANGDNSGTTFPPTSTLQAMDTITLQLLAH